MCFNRIRHSCGNVIKRYSLTCQCETNQGFMPDSTLKCGECFLCKATNGPAATEGQDRKDSKQGTEGVRSRQNSKVQNSEGMAREEERHEHGQDQQVKNAEENLSLSEATDAAEAAKAARHREEAPLCIR